MKRNLLFIVLLLSSCDKYTNHPDPNLNVVQDGLSVYLDYYKHFISNELGDLSNIPEILEISQTNVYIYPSTENLDGTTIPRAIFIGAQVPNGNSFTVVHDFSNLLVENNQTISGYISIRLVNGLEIYKIRKVENRLFIEEGQDLDLVPETDETIPGWWTCTTKCYKFAKDACDADPECKFLCDLMNVALSSCNVSIAVACGIHCSNNNGVFNPPPLPSSLPIGSYGF